MQYLTIVENNYDEAVRKARELYGDNIRIHSRRDFTTSGGLFTRKVKKCEITCYISEKSRESLSERDRSKDSDLKEFEKEARTPDPSTISEKDRLNTEIHRTANNSGACEQVLNKNYITGPFREKLLEGLSDGHDAMRMLSERIVQNTQIDYQGQAHPKHYMVFIGPTGTGKTTTLAKIAHLYMSIGKRVAVITLDSYRIGAFDQIKAFGDAFNIPVELCKAEDELILLMERYTWYDIVLVDTMGISNKDVELNLRLKGLTSQFDSSQTSFIFTVSPSMKEEDLFEHYMRYRQYNPTAMIATKLDESETIGNVLSFSYRTSLPLLFFTDGQKVPEDLEKASTSTILTHLKGFGLDIKTSMSQISPKS